MENQILDVNENTGYSDYAGFWLRFAAAIIDGLIIGAAFFITTSVFGISMFGAFSGMEGDQLSGGEAAAIAGGTIILVISLILLRWLYFALQESSPTQATIGKRAVGIKVTGMEGEQISFLKATGRHFGKIVSSLILNVGYIMAGFTDKKQALHDMMASCLVVKK